MIDVREMHDGQTIEIPDRPRRKRPVDRERYEYDPTGAVVTLDARVLPVGMPHPDGKIVQCIKCGENGIGRALREDPRKIVRVLHGKSRVMRREKETGIVSEAEVWMSCDTMGAK